MKPLEVSEKNKSGGKNSFGIIQLIKRSISTNDVGI